MPCRHQPATIKQMIARFKEARTNQTVLPEVQHLVIDPQLVALPPILALDDQSIPQRTNYEIKDIGPNHSYSFGNKRGRPSLKSSNPEYQNLSSNPFYQAAKTIPVVRQYIRCCLDLAKYTKKTFYFFLIGLLPWFDVKKEDQQRQSFEDLNDFYSWMYAIGMRFYSENKDQVLPPYNGNDFYQHLLEQEVDLNETEEEKPASVDTPNGALGVTQLLAV